MATGKIAVTLPGKQTEELRKRVSIQESASVCEFSAIIDQGLMETGGPLTAKERAWARRMLAPRKRRTK